MSKVVNFDVEITGNILIVRSYGALGDVISELDNPRIPESDRMLMLELYLAGLELGVHLGSNGNMSIDIDDLVFIKSVRRTIAKYNSKEKDAQKSWNDIIFYNVMSGVV